MATWQSVTIQNSPDLERISGLPRRVWSDADAQACADYYTAKFRTPHGTMRLRPLQAIALHEMAQCRGLFGAIRVGGGKTLLSLLAPGMFPDVHKPLLLLPASLIEKTRAEWQQLSKHWRIPSYIQIQSYETLGRDSAARWLEQQAPDFIFCDEAHRLKNQKAGVTRRVTRYMAAKPHTIVGVVSGTLFKDDIEDFAHLATWALKNGAPVPRDKGTLFEWAECLGVSKNPLQSWQPGPLLQFAQAEDVDPNDPKTTARRAFRRRMRETPGVVASGDEHVSCSLYINAVSYTPNAATEDNFNALRTEWETPDGWALADAVTVWRCARELALGLHYVWQPRPPPEWLLARKAWAKRVRDILAHNKLGLDTELPVRKAVEAGLVEGLDVLRAWQAIEPTFTPNTIPIWHDTGALDFCATWAKKPGIIWTEHSFFALELAKRTGLHYYGQQGVSHLDGSTIEKADPKRACIASIAANSTGRNLQFFSRNLVTSPPAGGPAWEQMLGRTHRDGQLADEVTVDVLISCRENYDGITRAIENARVNADTMGHTQKLLLADVNIPTDSEVRKAAAHIVRWDRNVSMNE